MRMRQWEGRRPDVFAGGGIARYASWAEEASFGRTWHAGGAAGSGLSGGSGMSLGVSIRIEESPQISIRLLAEAANLLPISPRGISSSSCIEGVGEGGRLAKSGSGRAPGRPAEASCFTRPPNVESQLFLRADHQEIPNSQQLAASKKRWQKGDASPSPWGALRRTTPRFGGWGSAIISRCVIRDAMNSAGRPSGDLLRASIPDTAREKCDALNNAIWKEGPGHPRKCAS